MNPVVSSPSPGYHLHILLFHSQFVEGLDPNQYYQTWLERIVSNFRSSILVVKPECNVKCGIYYRRRKNVVRGEKKPNWGGYQRFCFLVRFSSSLHSCCSFHIVIWIPNRNKLVHYPNDWFFTFVMKFFLPKVLVILLFYLKVFVQGNEGVESETLATSTKLHNSIKNIISQASSGLKTRKIKSPSPVKTNVENSNGEHLFSRLLHTWDNSYHYVT